MKIEVDAAPALEKFAAERKEMLSVRWEGECAHVRINSSSLAIMQECWKKAHFVLERGLQAKLESAATLYGTAIHKALEVFYSGKTEERMLPPNFERTVDLMGAGSTVESELDYLVLRAIRAFLQTASPLAQLPDSNKRSLATGAWTLMHYFKSYIDDVYVIYSRDGVPYVEKKCEALVVSQPNLTITLFGTIDCILHNPQNNTVLITDHKTSSVVGEQFYSRLKPNHQYTAYVLLAERALGIQTDKFLVNAIQVKPKPVTARGQPPHFPRQVTTRSAEDIEVFLRTLTYYVRDYLRNQRETFWPLGQVSACSAYNGCQFQKICANPNSLSENIISAEFHGGGSR